MEGVPILSIITFLPAAGAAVIALFVPRDSRGGPRALALLFSGVALAAALLLFTSYDRSDAGIQFTERAAWITLSRSGFSVQYHLGVDGISLPLVVLTALLGFLAVLASWHIELRPKEYFIWLLALETGVLGVFVALDFFLFFLFWEVELLPMYMLISIWGSGRREYSAMKFLIYTILGSAFMLVGILALFFNAGTFDMVELSGMDLTAMRILTPTIIFFLLFAAFAIKLPVFPLHTWLPDAHTDAPTAVSVMLAGVLLKMGGYGMIRICVTILPGVAQEYASFIAALAVVNILYGAAVTMMQTDLKRLIAYSSVSHMGYVLLGIAALGQVGLTGASLQMFTHGTITGLLFLLVGLTYDHTHDRDLRLLRGLAHRMPLVAVAFTVAGLASLGLPSLSGFVAELLVFLGTYPVHSLATVLGVVGIVLTAGYILWMLQRAFFGPADERYAGVEDATKVYEWVPVATLIAITILIGVYPAVLTDIISNSITLVVGRLA